jgi:hypothetical protein
MADKKRAHLGIGITDDGGLFLTIRVEGEAMKYIEMDDDMTRELSEALVVMRETAKNIARNRTGQN